jgi:hypothetical protein
MPGEGGLAIEFDEVEELRDRVVPDVSSSGIFSKLDLSFDSANTELSRFETLDSLSSSIK